MENEIIKMIVSLCGGLAVFIYGMNLMSDGLQKTAGDKMKNFLAMLTRNPFLGMLAGLCTTAVLQSSSATTVMVIGFVSAGLMTLSQGISVVIGANIGTTITAQLIAFNIGDYAWGIVFVGFVMFFFLKKHEKAADIGQIIFAFGLLFVGINTMSATMAPLAQSQVFMEMMLRVKDLPGIGVALGAAMTLIVQSSSATIAVLQKLASTAGPDGVHSIIGLAGSIPILFGDNIGTTITAILASIGQSINAKRTALAHVIFNLSGTLLFIWFIPQIVKIIQFISPKGAEVDVISRQIANTHTLFNVSTMLIWLPLTFVLVKIVTKLIPGREDETPREAAMYLDYNIVDRPVFAIHLAGKELNRLASFTREMIMKDKAAFLGNDEDKAKESLEIEESVNELHAKITDYLARILATESATDAQNDRIAVLMHVSSVIEHMGDYLATIAELAVDKARHGYEFSDIASAEIFELFDQISRMMRDTMNALETNDLKLASDVFTASIEIDKTEKRLRKKHMQRLYDKKCSPEFTVSYTDVIHNIVRIGDCCSNIAESVTENKYVDYEEVGVTA
ncbi:MAG: Na/Pi cotransporter family protein [Eubacteriaceae bacterium]|jgi:phosphate:Na+ symporter|nr:Na/Pi cotransporter family protein [Eubacteriaceae bacterium]